MAIKANAAAAPIPAPTNRGTAVNVNKVPSAAAPPAAPNKTKTASAAKPTFF